MIGNTTFHGLLGRKNESYIKFITSNDQGGIYNSVWKQGSYIYCTSDTGGLFVYSFDGSILTLLDSDRQGTKIYQHVWSDGTYIYCATSSGGGPLAYSFNGSSLTYINNYTGGQFTIIGNGINLFDENIAKYSFNGTNFTIDDLNLVSGVVAETITIDSQYIYLARATTKLEAYNQSDLSYITVNSETGNFKGVHYKNSYIYIIKDSLHLYVYSFNGTSFTLEYNLEFDDYITAVNDDNIWSDNNYLYITARDYILVYSLYNGINCTFIAKYQFSSITKKYNYSEDNYIYLAEGEDGLNIYKLIVV